VHKISILILFLFIFSTTKLGDQNSISGSRSIASFEQRSCKSSISKIILNYKSKSLVEKLSSSVIKPGVEKLSKFSLRSRLKFLNHLNAKRGKSKFLSEMYANTINQMITKGLLSEEDFSKELFKNNSGAYLLDFSYGEVRVTPKIWEGLPTQDETIDIILQRTTPGVSEALKLREVLENTELNPLELKEFEKHFVRYPKDKDEWKLLSEYLSFTGSMREKQQLKALGELPKLFYESDKGKHLNNFRSLRKNIDKYESKQVKKQLKKAKKNGMSDLEAKAFAKQEARRMTEVYSNLKYACRSTKHTEESKQSAKLTSKFFMGMGVSATAASYGYSNWDKDKTEFEWYGKLAHDLSWKIFFQFGFNAIMTDQSATFLKKNLAIHAFYTPADAIEASMYELEFGEKDSFIKEEFEKMIELRKSNDPKFVEEYNKAIAALNHKYFPERFRSLVKKMISGEIPTEKNEFDEILSLEEIATGELEDEVLRDKLMEAIALKLYQENAGQVQLGGQFLDRYVFVRSYDVLDVPKSLMVGLLIYKTICMGPANSVRNAMILSSVIYTLDQVISKFVYYKIRRKVINQ